MTMNDNTKAAPQGVASGVMIDALRAFRSKHHDEWTASENQLLVDVFHALRALAQTEQAAPRMGAAVTDAGSELLASVEEMRLDAHEVYNLPETTQDVRDAIEYCASWMTVYIEKRASPATEPTVAAGWQPIETAPKDGNRVLLLGPGKKHADGYWLKEAYAGNGSWIWPFVYANPTYWQALPAAPQTPKETP